MSEYSSERLLEMVESSGASKKDIYTQFPINRNTLDRWLSPDNGHLLDGFKIIRIANIIGVDPRKYFPQVQEVIDQVSTLGVSPVNNPQLQYIYSLIDRGDGESLQSLKQEVASIISENMRYRAELTRIMGMLNDLK